MVQNFTVDMNVTWDCVVACKIISDSDRLGFSTDTNQNYLKMLSYDS